MAHKNARQLLGEVTELLRELEVYSSQRDSFFSNLEKLDEDYQDGRFGYLEYQERQKAILRSRSREEWSEYYRACVYSLLKKVEFILSQAAALVYDDNSFSSLAVRGKGKVSVFLTEAAAASTATAGAAEAGVKASHHVEVFNIDSEIARLRGLLEAKSIRLSQLEELGEAGRKSGRLKVSVPKFEEVVEEVEAAEKRAAKARVKVPAVSPAPVAASKATPAAGKEKMSFLKTLSAAAKAVIMFVVDVPVTAAKSLGRVVKKVSARAQQPKPVAAQATASASKSKPIFSKLPSPLLLFRGLFKAKSKAVPSEFYQPSKKAALGAQRQGVFSAVAQALSKDKAKKGIFVEEIVRMEKQAKIVEQAPALEQKEPAGLAFGWFSARGLLHELTEKFRSKQEPIVGEKTAVPAHVKRLKEMRKKLYEEERLSGFDTTLLAQEARRVKKILEVEKPEVYQGSSVGLIANLTVRKISLLLVDTFPEFFGFLYNALRAANVKVLSNTYVNIMILSTLFVMSSSFIIMLVTFFVIGYPIYQIALRAFILSIISGFACATIFYAYPFVKIKERRRNIMTNMPFAINHMAAVATSGVPPVSMFELIAASREYAEIGIEVKKIVDFINIFGYDLLTAIRTVAATTPSQPFKEFLEGMVSTIETGGDLDRYLRQEADQAALTYNL
ncbi:type II secretion system F family protein, partial [Candidatus Woesearchaeota archaeon]|nr:type II secretion system F family protein [Candidatus Woesearchaeota archaeon]